MNERAKEQRNAYMKEWRERNKDKVKAAQERYWEKKFENMKVKEELNSPLKIIQGMAIGDR